jgi:hypothetical protein
MMSFRLRGSRRALIVLPVVALGALMAMVLTGLLFSWGYWWTALIGLAVTGFLGFIAGLCVTDYRHYKLHETVADTIVRQLDGSEDPRYFRADGQSLRLNPLTEGVAVWRSPHAGPECQRYADEDWWVVPGDYFQTNVSAQGVLQVYHVATARFTERGWHDSRAIYSSRETRRADTLTRATPAQLTELRAQLETAQLVPGTWTQDDAGNWSWHESTD